MSTPSEQAVAVAPKSRPLHEIVEAMLAVLGEIDEAEGELTDETTAKLDACTSSLEEKGAAYAAIYRMLTEEAEACDRFVLTYETRAKRKRKHADELKRRLFDAMRLTGLAKIVTATATIGIQKSAPALELTVAENDIPDAYVRMERVIDKQAIKAALQAGASLAFAKLTQGVHLRFRF